MEPSSSSNTNNGSKTLGHLPSDLITEILVRLSVETLLKFKCVCKTWLSEISSPQFIKSHLKFSRNSKNHANHGVIFQSLQDPHPMYQCSLSSILDKKARVNPRGLYKPDSTLEYPIVIYGNCNGLFCISTATSLVLYNPTTRKLKELPDSGTNNNNLFEYKKYGLCYNELEDDYKVVWLSVSDFKIYSLRTNSWRKFNDDPSVHECYGNPVGVGGVLHWVTNIKDISLAQIFAVDTVTYTHELLAIPEYDKKVRQRLSQFCGVVDVCGCLGFYHIFYKFGADIWMMKDSWTKVFTVPWRGSICDRPLVVLNDGETLLPSDTGCALVYNLREDSFLNRVLPNNYLKVCHNVPSPVYIESLVAPSSDGE